jgi:hypothetical protein
MKLLNFLVLATLTVFVGILAFRAPTIQIVESTNNSEKETKVIETTKVESVSSGPLADVKPKEGVKKDDEPEAKSDDTNEEPEAKSDDTNEEEKRAPCYTVTPHSIVTFSVSDEEWDSGVKQQLTDCGNDCASRNSSCYKDSYALDANGECFCGVDVDARTLKPIYVRPSELASEDVPQY